MSYSLWHQLEPMRNDHEDKSGVSQIINSCTNHFIFWVHRVCSLWEPTLNSHSHWDRAVSWTSTPSQFPFTRGHRVGGRVSPLTYFSKAMRTGGSPTQLCLYTVSRIWQPWIYDGDTKWARRPILDDLLLRISSLYNIFVILQWLTCEVCVVRGSRGVFTLLVK